MQVEDGLDVVPVTTTYIKPADTFSSTATAQKLFPCDSQRSATNFLSPSSTCSGSRSAYRNVETLSSCDINECNHESTVQSYRAVIADGNGNEEVSEVHLLRGCKTDVEHIEKPRIIPSFKRIDASTNRKLCRLNSSVRSTHHQQPVLSVSSEAASLMRQIEIPRSIPVDSNVNVKTVPRFTLFQNLKSGLVELQDVNQNEKMLVSNVFNVTNEDLRGVTSAPEADSTPHTLEDSKHSAKSLQYNDHANTESPKAWINYNEEKFLQSATEFGHQLNHKKKSAVRS
jgi:hypothetical protein